MISYKADYTIGSKPYLAKVITVGTESVEVRLGPSTDRDELDLIPLSYLYEHLDNYLQYVKDKLQEMTTYRLTDKDLDGRFAFRGYHDIDHVVAESTQWWTYVYSHRDETEGTPA